MLKLLAILILVTWNITVWAATCDMASFFSPSDNIEELVHQELVKAKKSIHCSLFGISNPRLAKDLINIKQAGLDIIITEDKKQAALQSDLHRELQKNGILVVIKKTITLEHNKFCIIDEKNVVMGSWNWSRSAQKQDNSVVVIRGCIDEARRFEQVIKRIIERDSD